MLSDEECMSSNSRVTVPHSPSCFGAIHQCSEPCWRVVFSRPP